MCFLHAVHRAMTSLWSVSHFAVGHLSEAHLNCIQCYLNLRWCVCDCVAVYLSDRYSVHWYACVSAWIYEAVTRFWMVYVALILYTSKIHFYWMPVFNFPLSVLDCHFQAFPILVPASLQANSMASGMSAITFSVCSETDMASMCKWAKTSQWIDLHRSIIMAFVCVSV